ncbi:hypothetical protein CMV_018836 [Castanea mollissima]|uniref:Uncharacterized protein n=1 Tax=Castanea mollissima TaxID=60419 RepID=A0A8J4VFI6_9ROSI|nr:hypothetical protein CMV_018836 [Castanea mollissima]
MLWNWRCRSYCLQSVQAIAKWEGCLVGCVFGGSIQGVLRYLWSLWIHDWVTLLLIGHVVLEFLVNAATVCP